MEPFIREEQVGLSQLHLQNEEDTITTTLLVEITNTSTTLRDFKEKRMEFGELAMEYHDLSVFSKTQVET